MACQPYQIGTRFDMSLLLLLVLPSTSELLLIKKLVNPCTNISVFWVTVNINSRKKVIS